MSYDLTNSKLLKEWDKIKDSDVFPSLDAFAELFYQNPSCKCYRKYTSYYSKEKVKLRLCFKRKRSEEAFAEFDRG